MKRVLIILFLAINAIALHAKFYIGITTTNVNLRECAGTDCNIVCKVKQMSSLLVDTDSKENDFYKVIYLDEDIEGYIHSRYIKLYQEVDINEKGFIEAVGQSSNIWPTILIKNKTNQSITIRLNNKTYRLKKQEEREIISDPGVFNIIVTSQGVMPLVCANVFENNMEYEWEFFITSSQMIPEEDKAYVEELGAGLFHKDNTCPLINGKVIQVTVKAANDAGNKPCESCYNIDKGI